MARAQYVAVPLPEGRRLGDLFGIDEDLLACHDYIGLYKSLCEAKRSHANFQLMDCVVTTIFIRYGRCFGSGVRSRTHRELKQVLEPVDFPTHQLAIDLRDKHFAHSVNAFETPEITVSLAMDSPERAVTSVSVGSRSVFPDMFVFDNLIVLINKLRTWVLSEQKAECARLLPLINERYSTDELYELINTSKPRQIRYSDVGKPRKGT
jgi:hypothetical protein